MKEEEQELLALIEQTRDELFLIGEAHGHKVALRNSCLIRLVEKSERELARMREEPFARCIHIPNMPSTGCRVRYHATWGVGYRLEYPTGCFKPDRWADEHELITQGDPLAVWAWIGFREVVYFTCTDVFPEPNGADDHRNPMSPLLQHLKWPRLGSSYCGFCCEIENSPLLRCFRGRNGTRVRHWQITFLFYQVDVVARKMWFPKEPCIH